MGFILHGKTLIYSNIFVQNQFIQAACLTYAHTNIYAQSKPK